MTMSDTARELKYVLKMLEAESSPAFQDYLRPERVNPWRVHRARHNFRRFRQQSTLQANWKGALLAESQVQTGDLQRYVRKVRDLFRGYIEAWLDQGKNSDILMERRPDILEQIQLFLNKQRGVLLCSSSGPSEIIYPPALHLPAKTEAARLFLSVLISRFCSRVQRCDRCHKIYLQKTNYRNKRFCARSCGNAAWQQRPSVTDQEETRLKRARKGLREWKGLGAAAGGKDWKRWVHERTNLSLNWLTRRQKSGCLRLPATRVPSY